VIKACKGSVKGWRDNFEPRIVAYYYQYCAYEAADLAGSLRLQYPANVRIVLVLCSGWVSEIILLQAFEDGLEGVFVTGCQPGDCHFIKGNFEAARRVRFVKALID
jgi:coenzyme F420-reducing hydrogenase delta subunit